MNLYMSVLLARFSRGILPEQSAPLSPYALKKASRSGLICSGFVAHIPCG